MRVRVARKAGFCWGVRRAMDATLETHARFGHQGTVSTLGPLIHNPQALDHLARRGVQETSVGTAMEEGAVIIRAHGIPLEDYRLLVERKKRGSLRITNATCPEVARVHSIIQRHAAKDGFTIILGQVEHAEVVAHCSYAASRCAVIESLEEARVLPDACLDGALVVAQTTFSISDFGAITNYLRTRSDNLSIRDTICPDTFLRQREAADLVRAVEFVVVVGGRSSNNTRHLVEVARQANKPFQWVECAEELDLEPLKGHGEVAVLAGASTPTWTVDEVVEALEQAGHPSRWRAAWRGSQTLQVPIVFGIGLLALSLHHMLGWQSWAGTLLPSAFHLSLCALLPYLDPLGLDSRGKVQAHFLQRNRSLFMIISAVAGATALWAAAVLGPKVIAGTLALAALGLSYLRIRPSNRWGWIRNVPAIRDLGQALSPAFLTILLPRIQGQAASPLRTTATFLICFCPLFAVHALRHLKAFGEDRILGYEILPMAVGSRATRWVAYASATIALGTWATGIRFGW